MAADWTDIEVELIVADYFKMLQEELLGRPYNKSLFRRNLLPLLNGRNNTSVEKKHQNISAVMIKYGYPWINGYKPLKSYQYKLIEAVSTFLKSNSYYYSLFEEFANRNVEINVSHVKFDSWTVSPPEPSRFVREPKVPYFAPVKKNYIEIEQKNT